MKKYTGTDGINTAMGLARVFMARAPNLIAAVDIATYAGTQVRNCDTRGKLRKAHP